MSETSYTKIYKRRKPVLHLCKPDEHEIKDDEYEIEAIIAHRVESGKEMEFHCCWKGFQEKSWEPLSNLVNCREVLELYKLEFKGNILTTIQAITTKKTKMQQRIALLTYNESVFQAVSTDIQATNNVLDFCEYEKPEKCRLWNGNEPTKELFSDKANELAQRCLSIAIFVSSVIARNESCNCKSSRKLILVYRQLFYIVDTNAQNHRCCVIIKEDLRERMFPII
ncbi:hypothetical protein BJ508DRAFT_314247 [Ascobolus immersus RN42]|uniref:Chromo domain-containing protein n=1 Tax=Ascobolus immersus RN42 TaxID=1160509 RepID=A0A3N4HLM6_ASCIM|nr:hypothetical protein BJ508DRAFT_314247 [Ascobolus immersus RN42]